MEQGFRKDGAARIAFQGEQDLREEVASLQARADCGLLNTREMLLLGCLCLRLGKPDEALMAVLRLLSRENPHPKAEYIRGLVRLGKGRVDGVHDLLRAAARSPMLMGRAVARLEAWFAGPGLRYDSPAMQAELRNMRALYQAALAEREGLEGHAVLKPSSLQPADEQAVRDALSPLAGDVLLGWLAQRPCDRLPRWRHHEILLEARPGLLWPPHQAKARLMELEQTARTALPELPDTTLGLRVYPLRASSHFRRQMRISAGRPFLTDIDAPASVS